MTSLRRSALLWMTVLLGLVGIVAVTIAYYYARSEAAGFLDNQLRQIALNAGEGLPDTAGPPVQHDPEDEFVLTIWDAAGRKIHASPPGIEFPRQPKVGAANVRAAGDDWRVYTSSDGLRTVQVAQRMSVREELAANAAIGAAAPILVVLPLAWLVIGWAIQRFLVQLDRLARDLAARSVGAREPLPLTGVVREVRPLIQAMNVLIERQRRALEQQKRFISDAAHELRTPLAALQIQVDGFASSPAETIEARKSALTQGIRRASTLANQLLNLARLDDPSPPSATEAVELAPLLLACVAEQAEIAARRGIDIGITRQDDATVFASPEHLRILFGNLIDNALRYTPAGGAVDVAVRLAGDAAFVEILDTGCGIPVAAESHIFDRFFRAASPDIEGTGLGLAIVRGIAERYGLSVHVGNRADGRQGVRATVELPTRPPAKS